MNTERNATWLGTSAEAVRRISGLMRKTDCPSGRKRRAARGVQGINELRACSLASLTYGLSGNICRIRRSDPLTKHANQIRPPHIRKSCCTRKWGPCRRSQSQCALVVQGRPGHLLACFFLLSCGALAFGRRRTKSPG